MRQAFRKVSTVLAFLVVLGMADSIACPTAEASYGFNDALGTIGIGAGIGAVLGLSTISFYDTPTQHLGNALIGAGAGLIVGLGVAAYLLTSSADENEINPDELLPLENKPGGPGKMPGKNPGKALKNGQGVYNHPLSTLELLASVPATFAVRSQPNYWAVAVQVLELRF